MEFTSRCSNASVFHTRAWLSALQRTYGYEPVALTTTGPGDRLRDAVLFCRVSSWMTGRRLVSLPFSDHCDPLVEGSEAFAAIANALTLENGQESGRYIELRPRSFAGAPGEFKPAAAYYLHVLSLRRTPEEVFSGFHKSCIQRAIRKAEREGVECEVGPTASLLRDFYRLHALTRRKHDAPIQPLAWFTNLAETFGNRLRIYAARFQGRIAAAILVLAHERTWVYKYGCSDPLFNRLGTTPFLFWIAIRDAMQSGATELDLGRSDLDNPGLMAFKDHLGAERSTLTYFRYCPRPSRTARTSWTPMLARRAYELVPNGIRDRVGSRLYRHFA